MRDSPAWYFVTVVGTFAVFLTILMFISLIDETSGHRSHSASPRSTANLGRRDLEKIHEWTVQDHWRVAHLFVVDQPARKPRDIQLDSRLLATPSKLARRKTLPNSQQNSLSYRSDIENNLDVRLDLSRPKRAQQGHRMVAGTVLGPGPDVADRRLEPRIHSRDPRLLVQASWEFGSDCNQSEYVAAAVRRPIRLHAPVPQPEPELPRIRREMPDLSLAMAMIRHFTTSGLFPPGSHLVSTSDRTNFPENDRRFPSELVSHNESRWKHFDSSYDHSISTATPYEGMGIYDRLQHLHSTSDQYDHTLRAVADVAFRIEWNAPVSVAAGETHRSRMRVINEGPDPVSRIEVRDFLSRLNTVVAAEPEAMGESDVDPETGERSKILHREIADLAPGDEQEFALEWFPEGNRRQVHRAQVIAHAEVSTSTDVSRPDLVQQMPSIPPEQLEQHPALACDVQHLDRVYVGQDVELEITVRNTGDSTLHQVKVEIELPGQLSHRDGRRVVFEAGTLPVRGRNRTVLKMSALHTGEAVNVVHVDAVERVEAHGRAVIQVAERRKEKDPRKVTAEPLRLPPPAASKPLNSWTPRLQQPVGECCCQKVPM